MLILQKTAFLIELLISESILCYHFKKQKLFLLRFLLSLLVIFLIAIFLPTINDPFYDIFRYVFLFSLTIIGMKNCFDENTIKILFVSTAAYTLQHIAYELFNLFVICTGIFNISTVIGSGVYDFFLIFTSNGNSYVSGNPFTIIIYIFIYYITYLVGYLCTHKRVEQKIQLGVNNTKMLLLSALILFFDVVVSAFIGYYSLDDFNQVYLSLLAIFNIFCCILCLILLFLEEKRGQIANDLTIIKHLLKEKEEQYTVSKSNIDLINQKCHDLKHQIRVIGQNKYLEDSVIKEIENTINIYDSTVKTGNKALDIILTEKSLYCSKNKIKLCCIIDGEQLSFMSETDLYSLFGNIIDNAIEAVSKLQEDKKIISLSIKKNHTFLIINIHNYYVGSIQLVDKLPVTTKKDSDYHGYGMKSIKMIVEKYGGDMSLKTDKNVFNLNIIFPLAN